MYIFSYVVFVPVTCATPLAALLLSFQTCRETSTLHDANAQAHAPHTDMPLLYPPSFPMGGFRVFWSFY